MRIVRLISLISFAGIYAWGGDSQRGANVALREGCLECHTAAAQGAGHEPLPGSTAPDLADRLTPNYTPSALASALWNHTPAMWRDMAARRTGLPEVSPAEWEDVFAWLYTLQLADKPADARQGEAAFRTNDCTACHALKPPQRGSGQPVTTWARLDDPFVLVFQMWNHASTMSAEFTRQHKPWPVMTGSDFKDIAAYVQYVQRGMPQDHFSLPEASEGRLPFAQYCASCHTGPMALENRASNQSWMDIGAGLWNHAPLMKPLPAIPQDDFRKIVAFAWETQYMGRRGNSRSGERVFETAGCVSCHRSPGDGSPMRPQSRGTITPWSMVTLSWGPARNMHQQMIDKGTAWPKLSPADISDLVAYLNTLPGQR
jgi:mono/diheme cytochrome c family protein